MTSICAPWSGVCARAERAFKTITRPERRVFRWFSFKDYRKTSKQYEMFPRQCPIGEQHNKGETKNHGQLWEYDGVRPRSNAAPAISSRTMKHCRSAMPKTALPSPHSLLPNAIAQRYWT